LPMGPAGEGFGGDVADAGAGGQALKRASVRTATCLPKARLAEGGGQLGGFFHAGAHRGPAAGDTRTSPGLDELVFDRGDGGFSGLSEDRCRGTREHREFH